MATNPEKNQGPHPFACPTCSGKYDLGRNNPRSLNCFHTLCFACLELMLISEKKQLKCNRTHCSAITPTPSNGVVGILPNFWMLEQIEEKLPKCDDCLPDDDSLVATYGCQECKKIMCSGHREVHLGKKSSKGHRVNLLSPDAEVTCLLHRQKVSVLCTADDVMICKDCTGTSQHCDHKKGSQHLDITEARDQAKGETKSLLEDASQVLKTMQTEIDEAKKLNEQLQQDSKNRIEEIEAFWEKVRAAIQVREEELIAEVKQLTKEKLDISNRNLTQLQTLNSDLANAVGQAESVLKRQEPPFSLRISRTFKDYLDGIKRKKALIKYWPMSDISVSLPNSLLSDIQKSTVTESINNCTVKAERGMLEVALRDQHNKVWTGDVSTLEVVGVNWDVKYTIEEYKEGKCVVKYVAPNQAHSLNVYVWGRRMKGSPFELPELEWRECYKDVTLSDGKKTATNNSRSWSWVMLNQGFSKGTHVFSLRINKTDNNYQIGVTCSTPTDNDIDEHEDAIHLRGNSLYRNGSSSTIPSLPKPYYEAGDEVELRLNCEERWFELRNKGRGWVRKVDDLPSEKKWFFVVGFGEKDSSVSLI